MLYAISLSAVVGAPPSGGWWRIFEARRGGRLLHGWRGRRVREDRASPRGRFVILGISSTPSRPSSSFMPVINNLTEGGGI